MTTFFLLFKLLAVVAFFFMFLRRTTASWGVGLLTVTSAVFLDALAAIFGPENVQATLGYFLPVLQGLLFAGAALFLWGVVRPHVAAAAPRAQAAPVPAFSAEAPTPQARAARLRAAGNRLDTLYDRQMLYEQIRTRFGREDVFDLIFDLGLNENDLVGLDQEMSQVIVRLMDLAERNGLTGALALAVERMLTPPQPESLPRPEKLNEDTPPTVLRHFLLARHNLDSLRAMAQALELDWEQLGSGSKKEKVRSLLLYLYRRNRIGELINLLRQGEWEGAAAG